MSTCQKISQWHRRLGHPSFQIMEKMFPHLFQKCNHELLTCDACELAKHMRVTYSISDNKSNSPFEIVRSDV